MSVTKPTKLDDCHLATGARNMVEPKHHNTWSHVEIFNIIINVTQMGFYVRELKLLIFELLSLWGSLPSGWSPGDERIKQLVVVN